MEGFFRMKELDTKTLEETAERAVENKIAQYADFSGLDIRVANEINAAYTETMKMYPQLEDTLNFVGSSEGYNEWVVREKISELKKVKAFANASESNLREMAISQVELIDMEEDTLGLWHAGGGKTSIIFNSALFSSSAVDGTSAKMKLSSWLMGHASGFDTMKGLADHEMAHQIEYLLRGDMDDTVKNWYNEIIEKGSMELDLSDYAKRNIREFIAESWMEYWNSTSPSPTARKVARYLILLLR
jgi:hypothetical protein